MVTNKTGTNANNEILYGVTIAGVLAAAEKCGDLSVLEALFPVAFVEGKGKEILERKKAKAEVRRETREADEEKREEFVLKMDRKTAEVLRCVFGSTHGSSAGPKGSADFIHQALVNMGIKWTYEFRPEIDFPNTWEDFYKKGVK